MFESLIHSNVNVLVHSWTAVLRLALRAAIFLVAPTPVMPFCDWLQVAGPETRASFSTAIGIRLRPID